MRQICLFLWKKSDNRSAGGEKGGFLRDETANKRDFRDKKSGGVREGACAPRHCKKSSCRGHRAAGKQRSSAIETRK